MSNWPPRPTEVEVGTWTRADLQVGDLIFCARPNGPLAWLCEKADEPWRHVGSLTQGEDGELVVVENIGPVFCHRDLDTFLSSYDTYGAARLGLDPHCIAAANQWMTARVEGGEDVVYAWDDLILAGLIALTRRGIFVGQRNRVRAALQSAASAAKEQLERRGAASLTCSAFVQLAYNDAGGDCTIAHDRWRSEAAIWPPRLSSLDEFFEDANDSFVEGFGDMSVLDLVLTLERDDRWVKGSHIEPDQLLEIVKVLLAAIAGYALHEPPSAISDDGRWVTPGDLWRSPTVQARGDLMP